MHRTKIFIKMGLIPLLFAIGITSISCSTESSIHIPPEEPLFFPRQNPVDGEQETMEALLFGKLLVTDRCLFVKEPEGGTSYLVIWPTGYTYSIEGDEIHILNGAGEVVIKVGEEVRLSGGEIPAAAAQVLSKQITDELPDTYQGRYWLVGDEVGILEPME